MRAFIQNACCIALQKGNTLQALCILNNGKEWKRKEKKRKEKKRKEKKRKDYAFRRQFIEKAKYYTGLPRDPQQCINDAANTATLALKQKGYNNMRKTVKSKSHWPCKLAAESGSGHKQALAMCDAAAGKGDS